MNELLQTITSGVTFAVLFVVIFITAKIVNDFLTPYNLDDELTNKDNLAICISFAGYLGAVIIIYIGAVLGPATTLFMDVLIVGGYSILGIILLNISRFINDKILLRHFSNVKELVEDRNAGVGAVQAGVYIATGLITAGSIHGEGGGPHTALVFFILGQVCLILFSFVYDYITPFSIHDELEKDNVAAGVAFAGTMIALGIILMSGLSGKFISWNENLINFGINIILGIVLLPVFRIFFDKIIIPQSALNQEIANDRNLGAAILEMIITVGFATILFFLLKD